MCLCGRRGALLRATKKETVFHSNRDHGAIGSESDAVTIAARETESDASSSFE